MFEPPLTGFSYSFTADGHYEEAYYRAIPNRKPLSPSPSSLPHTNRPRQPATHPAPQE